MATTSAGLTTFVNGDGSSSGQFRGYHQFGDAKTTNGEQMAQAPRPSSGQNIDRIPAVGSARLTSQDRNQTKPSPSGLGTLELVELTSNPMIEGILGPNKDGRVRNPVPSKLKGKTDNKQGNFGVMHMGTSPGKKTESHGRDAAAERDAAARKTSEATASRAKAAQSDKYVPPKKRGLEAALNESQPPANRGSPFAVSRDDNRQRARPLAPDETKIEQARLLTLLRSINPVTVVDQICKAVAYFGGIPGAPPPEDGIFPESANTRETGALFIGWLAEIFPDLSPRSPETTKDQIQSAGKKKGKPSKGKVGLGGDSSIASEPPNSRNGYGYGPAVSAPAWGLPPSLAVVNPQGPAAPIPLPEAPTASSHPVERSQQEHEQIPATPVKQQMEDGVNSTTSTNKRRRGRPKGSRNKGKGDGQQGSENEASTNSHIDGQDHVRAVIQGTETKAATESVQPSQAPPATTFPAATNQSSVPKTSQATLQYPDHSWQGNTAQNMINQGSVIPIGDGLSPEERAVLEAFRHQGPEAMNVIPPPVVKAKNGPEAGQKRKRPPPKPKVTAPPPPSYPVEPAALPSSAIVPHEQTPIVGTKDVMQWASVDSSTTPAPPPKRPRQRKPKPPPSNDPPSRNQTVSAVSSATPPTAPKPIPESATTSTQQSIPVSRPPAEGLEAHYERFASLQQQQQQQQNGRSNTPTVPQQHVRQHSKPSSVTPQQSTPQLQQQQMQQQKSQQSSQQQNVQRDDLKMNQTASARPSTTAFYNQRSQPSTAATTTTYNQQYPSHQPSQLYSGHQASPQMSTSTYRTSSTHTIAQASPQFSQAENTYRTSSPHTAISQPSPSFPQNDSSFRANNTHNLTQPSPSFPQADNRYRAPSTHSMSQPTTSYSASRSHNQSQPSHQGHYSSFSDSSYIDLPTLESLGHSSNSGNTGVNINASSYGQSLGVGLAASSRSPANSNTLYGSSSLGNTYDTNTNDLLRGISRTANSSNTAYGAASSGLNNGYETGGNEHDMRESLLRGLGRR